MISTIVEATLVALQHIKNKKGMAAVIAIAATAIAYVVISTQDMRENFVRRSVYMVGWYCDSLPRHQRAALRREVNQGSAHRIIIYCEGDIGLAVDDSPSEQ